MLLEVSYSAMDNPSITATCKFTFIVQCTNCNILSFKLLPTECTSSSGPITTHFTMWGVSYQLSSYVCQPERSIASVSNIEYHNILIWLHLFYNTKVGHVCHNYLDTKVWVLLLVRICGPPGLILLHCILLNYRYTCCQATQRTNEGCWIFEISTTL
mgnify:CR=1 FL=1